MKKRGTNDQQRTKKQNVKNYSNHFDCSIYDRGVATQRFFPLDLEQTDAGSAKRSDSPFCLLSLPFSSLFVAHLALWLMVVVKSMGGHKIKPILESFSQLIQSKIYRVLNICSPNPPDLPTWPTHLTCPPELPTWTTYMPDQSTWPTQLAHNCDSHCWCVWVQFTSLPSSPIE